MIVYIKYFKIMVIKRMLENNFNKTHNCQIIHLSYVKLALRIVTKDTVFDTLNMKKMLFLFFKNVKQNNLFPFKVSLNCSLNRVAY